MKRNLDIVRCILLQVEKSEDHLTINNLLDARDETKDCDYTDNEIIYHVELLLAHGFIDGYIKRDMSGDVIDDCINGVTWDGADFLESVRNSSVWRKAKATIKETVGSTTFEVVKQTCSLVAIQMIKNKLGD